MLSPDESAVAYLRLPGRKHSVTYDQTEAEPFSVEVLDVGSGAKQVLWNTRDLGYLTVHAGALLTQGKLQSGARSLEAGRLGTIEIRGSEIILGAPVLFNKSNIDRFDF